jgi:hypothetical protein
MKKLLLAASMLTALALPAQADLIIDPNGAGFFADLGGTGFGVAPRLLTLQQNVLEAGGTVAGPGGTTLFVRGDGGFPGTIVPSTFCTSNGDCGSGSGGGTRTGANESLVYSIAQLGVLTGGGWQTGAGVGIGLDTNETGSVTGLTFTGLTLTLYNSAGAVLGSFSGTQRVDISAALLDFQQGNGNSVFNIGLTLAQQAQYDAIINNPLNGGVANIFEGLRASFGCGSAGPAVCGTALNLASSDGAESFLAFNPVPGPIVGAGIPGLIMALGAMLGFNRFRKRRQVA